MMGLPIINCKGKKSAFPNYDVFLSLKIMFTLTNSEDPDKMPHCAAFHLGLHFVKVAF